MDHKFDVIDADAHHLDEPAYKNYLPERFRARSGPYFPSFGWDIFLNGTTGRKPANPEEYCKDLDVEKIGDAVAYPSNALAIGLVRELDLAIELAKAYNNWAYDFCKSTGSRVKYAAVIAPQVVPEAVKEIAPRGHRKGRRRCHDAHLRAVGTGFGPTRVRFDLRRSARARRARRLPRHGAGIGRQHALPPVHRGPHGVAPVRADGEHHLRDRERGAGSLPPPAHGFLEAGVGWVPYWMDRFDEKWHRRAAERPRSELLPSEYVKANRCYFTCEGEESALPLFLERFGDRCVMYASDYPHWDMEWPHSVSQVVGRKDISDKTKQKILADNAKAFYRFS